MAARNMIDEKSNNVTQGSLFTCAYSPSYVEDNILGIIISARCDIAEGKIPQYYFLPVIPYPIWEKRTLPKILAKRNYKNKINNLNSYLLNATIIDIFGIDSIKNNIELLISNKKNIGKVNAIFECLYCLNTGDIEEIKKHFCVEIKKIQENIIENREDRYFFIDHLTWYGPCIIDLSEINVLSEKTLSLLGKGIEFTSKSDYIGINNCNGEHFSYIVGVVVSPFIEHIMQKFALGLIRIGLENPKTDDMLKILK